MNQRALYLVVAALLAGCSFNDAPTSNEPTLASLKSAKLPEQKHSLPQVGLQKVSENYR